MMKWGQGDKVVFGWNEENIGYVSVLLCVLKSFFSETVSCQIAKITLVRYVKIKWDALFNVLRWPRLTGLSVLYLFSKRTVLPFVLFLNELELL